MPALALLIAIYGIYLDEKAQQRAEKVARMREVADALNNAGCDFVAIADEGQMVVHLRKDVNIKCDTGQPAIKFANCDSVAIKPGKSPNK